MENEQERIERERQERLGTLGDRATHAGMAAEKEAQRASNQGDGHGTEETKDPAEQGKRGDRDQSTDRQSER